MEFENASPFPALAYDIEDAAGETFEVIVARGTFQLTPLALSDPPAPGAFTHTLVPVKEQADLAVTDVYFGEMNRSSVRTESDLAQRKPRCDVLVIADAHSPDGQPTRHLETGISVERTEDLPDIPDTGTLLSYRLIVHGPRSFVRGKAAEAARLEGPSEDGWSLTEPEPFTKLPVRFEHAFGGDLRVDASHESASAVDSAHRLSDDARARHPDGEKAPIAHATCLYNPVGTGFLEQWYAGALGIESWPAPRIETPGHEITPRHFSALVRGEKKPGDDPALTPQGFGVIAKPWQPRLPLAGTFDAEWLEETWPRMPKDFDMAYWNGAHPRMQCAHLFGGERVTLHNLSAPGTSPLEDGRSVIRFEVPDVSAAVRLKTEAGQMGWGGMTIDTLIIDLEEQTVSLVWRLVLPSELRIANAMLTSRDHRRRAA